MRSTPSTNATILKIQQEINEVAQRENELRVAHQNSIEDERVLHRTVSNPTIHSVNGVSNRRYIPNTNTKGVMQKFFKMRGKISTVSAMNSIPMEPKNAWIAPEVVTNAPSKALIPTDKPLRKGFVPIQQRIQSELRELKDREEELRTERRKSLPDLMAALEAEDAFDMSRSPSPPVVGKLKSARSLSHLLDEEYPTEINSAPSSLRPARSLAELCDAEDEEINSPRSLIEQWESRIREAQRQV